MLNWGVAEDASGLHVFTGSVPIPCDQQGADFARFGPIPIPYRFAMGILAVDIVTPPPRRPSEDDPRLIGVNFTRAALEREG